MRLSQALPDVYLPAVWPGPGILPVVEGLQAVCVGVQSWHVVVPLVRSSGWLFL